MASKGKKKVTTISGSKKKVVIRKSKGSSVDAKDNKVLNDILATAHSSAANKKKEKKSKKTVEEKTIAALGAILGEPSKEKLVRRKISRRRPGSTAKILNYFDASTQASIVSYQQEVDPEAKKKIYVATILPAFDSLVENLINVYGFQVIHESKADLKNECLEFLYNAVGKFNPERGSKAFSYFNVVAKNWLTIKSKQNQKKVQSYISIDNKEDISPEDLEMIENYKVMPSYDDMITTIETHDQIIKLVDAIGNMVKTDNERACIAAVKTIMASLEEIDLLSKRAILNYCREISGLSAKSLSISLSSIKRYYRELRRTEEFSRS